MVLLFETTLSAPVCVIVMVLLVVHPTASVIVIVYVPALNPVAEALVPPVGDQL
jgi:hypothetical protein